MPKNASIATHSVHDRIHSIRGQKILLDSDLSILYGVSTKALLQAMRRNGERFPGDFVFQLTRDEAAALRSQFVTLKMSTGSHRKYLPFAFTEQGVAMLSSVLRSKRAIAVNIAIMRAFVRLRQSIYDQKDLVRKLDDLEKTVSGHDKHIATIFEAIRKMIGPPESNRRRIGF